MIGLYQADIRPRQARRASGGISLPAAEVRAVCRGFRRAEAELHRRELYPLWGRAWQRQMRAVPE